MSRRKIISIDAEKCNGCGLCIPNCPEGAIRIIDGKARLVSDLFCDGLGACLGHCPEGAISVLEREAEPYSETRVMETIAAQGAGTIRAHLDHLKSHGEDGFLSEAIEYLRRTGAPVPEGFGGAAAAPKAGCAESAVMPSALSNWPVQLHLISPASPQLAGKEVLLTADCAAYAMADFHRARLAGNFLAIACPKLDDSAEIYREKITDFIDRGGINALTVVTMEVPCCGGLLALARDACGRARRKIPLKSVVVAIRGGGVLSERYL